MLDTGDIVSKIYALPCPQQAHILMEGRFLSQLCLGRQMRLREDVPEKVTRAEARKMCKRLPGRQSGRGHSG